MKTVSTCAALAWALAVGAPGHAQLPDVPPDLEVYAKPQRLVTLDDGRRMNVHCTGTGSPTVILEGGWTTTTIWWRDIQGPLAGTTRVCSYDRAGYGFSDAGALPRTAGSIASDLGAMLRAGGIEGPYVLVAHSLGGLDVRMFADRHLDQVAGMVLVDPTVEYQVDRMGAVSSAYGSAQTGFVTAIETCSAGVIAGTVTADMPASRMCIDPPSKTLPASINAARRAQQLTAGYQGTAASELLSMTASSVELEESRRSYGDMPLIVLTAAEANADYGLPKEEQASLDKTWWEMHDAVSRLSTRGSHRLVADSSHFIPKEKPDVVIDAVKEVVAEVRAGVR